MRFVRVSLRAVGNGPDKVYSQILEPKNFDTKYTICRVSYEWCRQSQAKAEYTKMEHA